MTKIYLHKEDLIEIMKFMDSFGCDVAEITCDNSSGIGSIIEAHIHNTILNGHTVTVKKTISDESSW